MAAVNADLEAGDPESALALLAELIQSATCAARGEPRRTIEDFSATLKSE